MACYMFGKHVTYI